MTTIDVLAGPVRIGTAGWSIPSANAGCFPGDGSHLSRYAGVLAAVEINSSFHRPHRSATYQRWAGAVPSTFRFAVKLPKAISHVRRMVDAEELLDAFAAETAGLGEKLAVVLVQFPPSLIFDAPVARAFFKALSERTGAAIACEPRHASWFAGEADACLAASRVARVAADPVLAAGGEQPGGWRGLRYHRLHGAPRVYHSRYEEPRLRQLADDLNADVLPAQRWCMFDNTASGGATADALALRSMLED